MRMRRFCARCVAVTLFLPLFVAALARGDEPDSPTSPATKDATSTVTANSDTTPAKKSGDDTTERQTSDATELSEANTIKKVTIVRLKELDILSRKVAEQGTDAEKAKETTGKELRDLLQERLRTLELLESTVADRKKAEAPDTNPEHDEGSLRSAVARAEANLAHAKKDRASLLPESFRHASPKPSEDKDAHLTQVKDAISAAQDAAKESKDAVDALKSSSALKGGSSAAHRADRDAIRQRLAALTVRKNEGDAVLAGAATPEAKDLARERLMNIEWEARLEAEKLRNLDAHDKSDTRQAATRELELKIKNAQSELAQLTLEHMQAYYRDLVSRRQHELQLLTADFKAKSETTSDPLERYRAKRALDLLNLHTIVLKEEQESATTPPVSADDQKSLLARERADFESLKKLVESGRTTNVVANRMNNTFRRLSSRRAFLVRNELAELSNLLTKYENNLTDVELEQLNDTSENREAVEALLDSIPVSRRPEAKALCARLEAFHKQYLERRRAALVKLVDRTETAREAVLARLKMMDEAHAYLRTHIFWVRDSVPLGPVVLGQIALEGRRILQAAGDMTDDLTTRSRWSRASGEFLLAIAGVVGLPAILHQARRWLRKRLKSSAATAPTLPAILRSILLHVGVSALWPSYILLWAYAVRMAPWPRSTARPAAFVEIVLALAVFIAALARFVFGSGGLAESLLHVPSAVARQFRRVVRVVTGFALALLLPDWLIQRGLIVLDDRPISAVVLGRVLILAYEIVILIVVCRLVRARSPLIAWLTEGPEPRSWLARHRRPVAWALVALIAAVIGLDAEGYGFTAQRISAAVTQTGVLLGVCGAVYWIILRTIDHHSWQWIRASLHSASDGGLDPSNPDDLAGRLRRLTGWIVPIAGVIVGSWVWNIDLALFQSIGEQAVWGTKVTVGEVTSATVIFLLTIAAWRHMGALFAVAVFPRMSDDQGLRFAVLTLCRYVVLGVGCLTGLSAIHLGWNQIQVVLAALGVGLGFGLQEIVSNFVCGIILLVERPIRVGDIVTVSGMSGKVERINIRATTITNAENQSMIVPNREFITSNLVNWTHKDRIIRASIDVSVALGSDPDTVSELLLTIAREDPDVLRNPVPCALMQEFKQSSLLFSLQVFVPDPSLAGRVKHRLCREIQQRFLEAGIAIPLPAQELHLRPSQSDPSLRQILRVDHASHRLDPAHRPTPAPHPIPAAAPQPAEDCHRGVDE
jgi:small-conductance mechanosensitive channel